MNRKEGIVIAVLLIISYFGGVYGATTGTAISNVFVTNFPKNQNVTVTNFPKSPSLTLQTAGVDIEILNSVPGILIAPPAANLTSGFAFTPRTGFVQVTAAILTIEWSGTISQGQIGDMFGIQINGQSATVSQPMGHQATMLVVLPSQNIVLGADQINIFVIPAGGTPNYLLYQVRLTLQYTFNG